MVTETDPGGHLKRWRAQSGASQRQLADLLGISHTSVRRIEAGEVQPNSDVLARFAEVTGEGSGRQGRHPAAPTGGAGRSGVSPPSVFITGMVLAVGLQGNRLKGFYHEI